MTLLQLITTAQSAAREFAAGKTSAEIVETSDTATASAYTAKIADYRGYAVTDPGYQQFSSAFNDELVAVIR